MNKAIIFDMDGVIIDSEPVYIELERQMYREYRVPITKEEALKSMGRSLNNWWVEIADRYRLPVSGEELAAEIDRRYMCHLKNPDIPKIAMPGIFHLMEKIKEKNWKIAIASSSTTPVIEIVVDIFNLEPYIDIAISGDDIAQSKPHPEIFEKAARHFNLAPEQCLVIEDSQSGLLAAKAANMYCAVYKSAPEGLVDYALADFAYDNHYDVFPMIESVWNT